MIFDSVRSSCRYVAEHARHVRLLTDRLEEYAQALPLEQAQTPDIHPERHHLGHGDDTVAFFLTLDTVNFGSGWFPVLKKRAGMSGYFTVASALTDHYRTHGPLCAEELERITTEDCAALFGQDPDDEHVLELMTLFSRALRDLGEFLLSEYSGSFRALVDDAGNSAARLVEILIRMPFFRDVQQWNGQDVHFYKRAQLTAADLSIAFGNEGPGRFDDLDRLTIFADNLVPHVLRMDGLLEYTDDLLARIDAEELIPQGSHEEIEIRATALHATELMRSSLLATGAEVTSMGLDYLLWNRGQARHYKRSRPRHRTRCVYY